jgi:hypothetical protein
MARTDRLDGRNGRIYRQYLFGKTQAAIAEIHGISQERVGEIIRAVVASIPEEDLAARKKRALDQLDVLDDVMAEIMDSPLPPAYSNGRPMLDANGRQVLDAGPRMAATDRLIKIHERQAKLLGLDAAQRVDVAVSEKARQAATDAAATAIAFLAGDDSGEATPE